MPRPPRPHNYALPFLRAATSGGLNPWIGARATLGGWSHRERVLAVGMATTYLPRTGCERRGRLGESSGAAAFTRKEKRRSLWSSPASWAGIALASAAD
jgi:hypothetical protein